MKRILKIIIVLLIIALLSCLFVFYDKYDTAKSIVKYLEKNGYYSMRVCVTDTDNMIKMNCLINGNKEDYNFYGKLFWNDEIVPISEFYVNENNVLFNLKTTYDYALEKIKLNEKTLFDKGLSEDVFISKNEINEIIETDSGIDTFDFKIPKGEIISSVYKLKKCKSPNKASIIDENETFTFYSYEYKDNRYIIGIKLNNDNQIEEIYLYLTENNKTIEIKYNIQEDDSIIVSIPKERKFTYIEKILINEIVDSIKKLK